MLPSGPFQLSQNADAACDLIQAAQIWLSLCLPEDLFFPLSAPIVLETLTEKLLAQRPLQVRIIAPSGDSFVRSHPVFCRVLGPFSHKILFKEHPGLPDQFLPFAFADRFLSAKVLSLRPFLANLSSDPADSGELEARFHDLWEDPLSEEASVFSTLGL